MGSEHKDHPRTHAPPLIERTVQLLRLVQTDGHPAGEHLAGEVHAVHILIEDDLAGEHHVVGGTRTRTVRVQCCVGHRNTQYTKLDSDATGKVSVGGTTTKVGLKKKATRDWFVQLLANVWAVSYLSYRTCECVVVRFGWRFGARPGEHGIDCVCDVVGGFG